VEGFGGRNIVVRASNSQIDAFSLGTSNAFPVSVGTQASRISLADVSRSVARDGRMELSMTFDAFLDLNARFGRSLVLIITSAPRLCILSVLASFQHLFETSSADAILLALAVCVGVRVQAQSIPELQIRISLQRRAHCQMSAVQVLFALWTAVDQALAKNNGTVDEPHRRGKVSFTLGRIVRTSTMEQRDLFPLFRFKVRTRCCLISWTRRTRTDKYMSLHFSGSTSLVK
jgi:hypothetical protein